MIRKMVKIDEEMRHVIFSRPTHSELQAAATRAGMIPLKAHVRELVISGDINIKEMLHII